jgi:hypothetical protein
LGSRGAPQSGAGQQLAGEVENLSGGLLFIERIARQRVEEFERGQGGKCSGIHAPSAVGCGVRPGARRGGRTELAGDGVSKAAASDSAGAFSQLRVADRGRVPVAKEAEIGANSVSEAADGTDGVVVFGADVRMGLCNRA